MAALDLPEDDEPLVKGGQGRGPDEAIRDAKIVAFVLVCLAVGVAIVLACSYFGVEPVRPR